MSEWIRVKDKLPDGKVIACYKNRSGKVRRIMAEYFHRYTIESSMDDGVEDEYCEDNDNYYIVEGWYEIIDNWEDWGSVRVTEGEVTHWMPLPEPPKEQP
jgi:hypothetical protein